MPFPRMDEVAQADKHQLARWLRYLPLARNEGEVEVTNEIFQRFIEAGGWTPELSKAVGWPPL